MTTLNLTPKEAVHLRRIKVLLEAAERIFQENFDRYRQNEILDVHREETSLPHALRWGTQAAEEILKNQKPPVERPPTRGEATAPTSRSSSKPNGNPKKPTNPRRKKP